MTMQDNIITQNREITVKADQFVDTNECFSNVIFSLEIEITKDELFYRPYTWNRSGMDIILFREFCEGSHDFITDITSYEKTVFCSNL